MTTTSSQLVSTSPPHSTLPPELIDQILQDSSLSKSNLARCCLVNKTFEAFARPTLYLTIKVCIIWLYGESECWLDDATRSLSRTLLNDPSLGQYARKVGFLIEFAEDEDRSVSIESRYDDYESVVEQVMGMLPRLDSLDLSEHVWDSDHAKESILERGSQWREFETDGISLEEDMDRNRRIWSKLRNLKKLRCEAVDRSNGDTSPIPDHLRVLDITSSDPQDFPLSLSPGSQLRVLRMIPSNSNLQHLGSMGQLRHLYLFINYYTSVLSSETLSSLSRLPLLESLSVEYYGPTRLGDSLVDSLLHHLPRSLLRLDFPRCYPFDALKDSLRTDTIPRLRILGLARLSVSEELERGVVVLRQICEGKGVAIERIILREDIFLV